MYQNRFYFLFPTWEIIVMKYIPLVTPCRDPDPRLGITGLKHAEPLFWSNKLCKKL